MKTLDQRILKNMQAELNICKAKRSVMTQHGLAPSILTKRIEFLEGKIVEQKAIVENQVNFVRQSTKGD